MKGISTIGERDREATERRLLDTIGKMIAEDGFEKIGINAIATQSNVSKILIYRYFGSVEGLMGWIYYHPVDIANDYFIQKTEKAFSLDREKIY